MNGLPNIAVLCIGGTITMTGEGGAGVLPRLDAAALVRAVPALADIAVVHARTLSVVPSPHMDLETVVAIAGAVTEEAEAGADGVVLTHGTDTIEESAFALDLLLGPGIPVAVTGAMRNPALPGADGPANLLAAVRVAASRKGAGQARGLGVVVVMDDQVHAPRFVRKVHTTSVAAFRSEPLLLGQLTESRLALFADLPALPRIGFEAGHAPAPVALLTAVMGDDGRLADGIVAAGYAGLVVAGMGGGHVPPAMVPRLESLAVRMPVIVATRTGGGATLAQTYAYPGAEIELAERGLIRAGWLPPLKARIALALLLGAGADRAAVRAFFASFGGG